MHRKTQKTNVYCLHVIYFFWVGKMDVEKKFPQQHHFNVESVSNQRYYFDVFEDQMDVAKALGVQWDFICKKWFVKSAEKAQVMRDHGFLPSLDVCDKLFDSKHIKPKHNKNKKKMKQATLATRLWILPIRKKRTANKKHSMFM